jgi:chromatin assembly factor 1 subunit A
MRLGAFFGAPTAYSPPSTPEDVSSGISSAASSRRSSIASVDVERPVMDTKAVKLPSSEFSGWILPFFPHEHTNVAPYNRFLKTDPIPTTETPELGQIHPVAVSDSRPFRDIFGPPKLRNKQIIPVRTLYEQIGAIKESPIDLTTVDQESAYFCFLRSTTYKILSFREDIRPSYQGTFTRAVPLAAAKKLSRDPVHRGLPLVDYDYDSEAEWEAPDVGDEDLEDEDEMSDEEDAADDMADFLDDQDEITRRRINSSDAEPISTGICWQDEMVSNVSGIDLTCYRMDVLHDDTYLPIDPLSSIHWSQPFKMTPLKGRLQPTEVDQQSPIMQPPRLPLGPVNSLNNSLLKKMIVGKPNLDDGHVQKENREPLSQNKAAGGKKPVKIITSDLLPAFKAAVSGSDLNKIALVEILKKQFPKCPKDAIKGTLEMIAVRQGAKEVDKRWVLIA